MSEAGKKTSGRVWDPLVRLFHWTLVAAFATAWFIRSEAAIHETAGKTVLVLVILRAAWGLVGPGSARFETFIKGPVATLRYVISILRGKPAHYPGHNPAGAAMIGALLLSLTATTVSGVLMTTTAFWGSTWIEWVHGTAATLTVFLIAGHLLGVIAACFQHRENLPWSMVTGRKWVSVNTERFLGPTMFTRRRNLAAVALIATGFGVWSASGAVFNAGYWRMPKIIKAEASKGGCEVDAVSGPQIMVYPSMQVQYDVTFSEGAGNGTAAVPTGLALQRRPQVDVSELVQDCKIAFEAKSSARFGFANVAFASFVSAVEAVRTAAVKGVAESQTMPVRQIGLSSTSDASPGAAEASAAEVARGPAPDAASAPAGRGDTASDISTTNPAGGDVNIPDAAAAAAPASHEQVGIKVLSPIITKPKLKTAAAKQKADFSKKAAPARAKTAKIAVKKSKKKAAAAKPLSKKAVRKLLKRKKKSAWRAPAGSSSSGSNGGSGSGNSASGSISSGSGSGGSGSGSGSSDSDDDDDDNSGSGSSNSGSGSGNGGSGSSGSGSNSGSGGGGDEGD